MNEKETRLSPNEIRKIKDFVIQYSELNERVLEIEKKLDNLEVNKTEILSESQELSNEINKVREEEDNFRSMLLTKYGNFELNFETFEIKQS